MGQTIGRAPIQSEVLVFLNLPRGNIIDLWEAFNDIAEGFGLTLNEVQDILRVALKEYLGCTDCLLYTSDAADELDGVDL
eukprot:14665386-Ditylum_brightwellii.AAC.1